MWFDFFNYFIASNSLKNILTALVVFVGLVLILRFFKTFGVDKIKKLNNYTFNKFDNFLVESLQSIGWLFCVVFSLFVASQFLILGEDFKKWFDIFSFLVFLYYGLQIVQTIVDLWILKIKDKKEGDEDYVGMAKFFRGFLKWFIWIIVVLLVLQNIGFNISTIVAGLGVSGIIIAFALQNILLDLFSFLSIYLDKPFVVGDFIIIGEESGTVKKIGIRSTRVLSLKGEELIISNRKLMDNVIHNYKRLVKRRKTFLLKIAGNTNSKKLKEALDIIKNAIKKQDLVEYDRVNFSDIVGGGYIFEAVYFIKSNDYNKYMDIQESINFKIIEDFEKKDIKLNN